MRPSERPGGRRKPTRKAERVERKGPALQTSRPGRAEMDADAKVPWKCARPAAAAPADEVVSAGADRTAHVLPREGHDTVGTGGNTSPHLCFWATFQPFPHARREPLLGPIAQKSKRRPGLDPGPRFLGAERTAGPRIKSGATTASMIMIRQLTLRLHIRRHFTRHARRHLFRCFHGAQQIAAGDLLAIGFGITTAQQLGDQRRIGFDAFQAGRR